MSIISDALKKAEREKVLKEKIEEERARLNEALEAARQYDRLISEKLSKLETEGGKGLAVEETTEARPFQVAFPERRSRHGLRAFLYAFTFFTVLGIALFVIMKWPQHGREVVVDEPALEEPSSGDWPTETVTVQAPPHPSAKHRWTDPSSGGNPLPLSAENRTDASSGATGARGSVSSPLHREAEGEGRVRVDERLRGTVLHETERLKTGSVENAAESEPQTMPGQTSAPSLRQPSVIPYVLSGITKMGEDRFALINNQILRAGDWVNGATVKAILDEEVVLETTFGELKLKISR